MKDSDIKILKDLKNLFTRLLEDQKQARPYYRAEEITGEIQGSIADMLHADKVENQALVVFVDTLFDHCKDRSHKQILQLLQDVNVALTRMIDHNEPQLLGKEQNN